jgi:nitroreductase
MSKPAKKERGHLSIGPRPIKLLNHKLSSEKSLAMALLRRRTTRKVGTRKLPLQMLSNLLWAAGGVNRRKGPFGMGGRTAASASNSQEIDIYVILAEGAYLFDPFLHQLTPVVMEDMRRLSMGRGQGREGVQAPVHLIYVADIDKLVHTAGYQEPGLHNPAIQRSYYYVDTGLIAANVYLYAASVGLGAWFHNCDRERLSSRLRLRSDQRVLFGQTVGYAVRPPYVNKTKARRESRLR